MTEELFARWVEDDTAYFLQKKPAQTYRDETYPSIELIALYDHVRGRDDSDYVISDEGDKIAVARHSPGSDDTDWDISYSVEVHEDLGTTTRMAVRAKSDGEIGDNFGFKPWRSIIGHLEDKTEQYYRAKTDKRNTA